MPRAGLSRTAVTAAALQLVDDGGAAGFANLTLAAVAAHAGVAVPSLYKHVASLGELRRDVAVASVTQLTTALTAATIGRSGAEAVRALAAALRAFAREQPGRYVATQVAADPDDPAAEPLAHAGEQSIAVIAGALRAFELAPELLIDAIRVLRSALHGFVLLELGGGFRLPHDIDRSFAVLLEMTIAGIERLPSSAPTARVPSAGASGAASV